MFRMDKEALSISAAVFSGLIIIIALFMAASLVADKVFSDHLWPRVFIAALIVLVLGYVLFRNRRKGKQFRN